MLETKSHVGFGHLLCSIYVSPAATDMDRYSATSLGRTAALLICSLLGDSYFVACPLCLEFLFLFVFFRCLFLFSSTVYRNLPSASALASNWVDRQSHFAP